MGMLYMQENVWMCLTSQLTFTGAWLHEAWLYVKIRVKYFSDKINENKQVTSLQL